MFYFSAPEEIAVSGSGAALSESLAAGRGAALSRDPREEGLRTPVLFSPGRGNRGPKPADAT